jgi:outer membrane immunogenic protein
MRLVAATLLYLLALNTAVVGQTGPKSAPTLPLPSWTGFYAGVNAGGLWNSLNASTTVDWSRVTLPGAFANAAPFVSIAQPNSTRSNAVAFIGGGQVGYNLQITDRVVVGVEADYQGVPGSGHNWRSGWIATSAAPVPSSMGTARGRAGYLVTPTLQVYGTGGLAYGAGN